jgi:cell cycle sensor histidine kinase DivJ
MDAAPLTPPTDPAQSPQNPVAASAQREVVWWHGGWALALAASALGLWFAVGGFGATVALALAAGLVPAAVAIARRGVDGGFARALLLGCWAMAAVAACLLTGGVSGPLAAWCLAPVAAAAALGGARPLAQGAALAFAAIAAAALAQALGATMPALPDRLSFGLGLVSIATTSVALGAALMLARRRLTDAGRLQARLNADLRRCLDVQPHLILVMDPTGRIEASFGAAPPGVSLQDLRSRGLLALAEPTARRGLLTALAAAAQEGRAEPVVFARAGASHIHLSLEARALDNRVVASLRDASAEHERQAQLEIARQDAESLNIGKSRFLANMSHELRTPLNAIMGFSDIMRERMFGPLPGKYAEYAELIHDAGAHLLDLINDVLDMSKIEAARYELAKEPLDAREPIAAALRLMRLQADDAGVQLRGVLPGQPLEVEADRRALKQIALNLISNALKFTPRGGLVTVSLQSLAGAMELSVADTGLGIAQADLERLGRPYEQAGDMGQKARGTGLGLSLVRAFAELHGGEMAIESQLGEGTAVTVRLPVLLAPLVPEAAVPSAPASAGLGAEPPPDVHAGGAQIIAFTPHR